jgi:GNAT superfamily N-acetyltransferase
MSLTLRPAVAADVEPLLALVDGIVAWLVARGRSGQWGSAPLSARAAFRERTAAYVAADKVTVADRDGAVVGAIVLDTDHPPYVPPGLVPPGALYVHTLVSDRTPAGAGAGALLLDVARSRAANLGVPLALDHWAGSPELATRYERAGFTAVGGFTLDHAVPWPGTVRVLTR